MDKLNKDMKKIPLSGKLRHFGSIFTDAGFNCYLVGGAVRNIIAGLPPSDFDFTTDATPEEVIRLFRRVIPTGIQHGTVTVRFRGESYEVTTFRLEEGYTDSRRPDAVHFTRDIDEDLSRRDFTINAIAASLKDGKIVDPNDGQNDIQKKVLRCIGTPEERFNEDGLRILRLFRFMAQLGFKIEGETLTAASLCREKLQKISAERIRVELVKTVCGNWAGEAFRLMQQQGILEIFLPELAAGAGVEQNSYHYWDVFEHSIRCLEGVGAQRMELRLAALLHDVAKPASLKFRDGEATFYNHEVMSADQTFEIMRRLKFSNKEIEEVTHLVRQHMFNYTPDWTDKAVRRFIARVGKEKIADLFILRKGDRIAHKGEKPSESDLIELSGRIQGIIERGEALSIKELEVNGNDLMGAGIPGGRVIGVILEELLETVMQDPGQNEKEKLLEIAINLYDQRIQT